MSRPTSTLNALANASDVDAGSTLSVTNIQASLPAGVAYNAGTHSFTLDPSDAAFQHLANGQTTTVSVSYEVSDGITSTPTSVSWIVTGTNDAPVVTSGAAAVSEEGLTNGVADTLPAILDTTNSTTASGTITASDVDSDALTMTLGVPSAPLKSGGVTIAWALQDNGHALIGTADATTIITATITDAGAYTVTLSGPIDHPDTTQEDDKTFTVPVSVSDGHTTTPTTLSVSVEDDSPKAGPVDVSVVPTDSKTNLMLILDLSGSMDSPSGLTGLTRLDVAKAAVNELLEQYDSRGDVMVRIVTFSDSGAAVGNAWKSVADAKAAIAGLAAGGATHYDAALSIAISAFDDGGKLTDLGTHNVQNVSYFLSDGDPTANHGANGQQAAWESFLTTNNVVSFALGISNVAPQTANLDPIAFDPAPGLQLADTPIRVTDLGQLANTLVFTIPPVTGSVLTGAGGATSDSFGADGGHVQSITVDGATYTFNPASNSITTSGGGSFTYNETTKTLTVDTDTGASGGELAMVMTTGAFTFQPPTGFSSESVGFVLVDRDGDTASSTLHFSAAGGPDHPPIVRDDHVITNISGGSGTNIVIPDSALLYNDSDADGQTIAITGAITNVAGATSVAHASGNVTFTDNNTNGGSFTYTGSTTSPAASDTGNVTVDRSQTGTTLTGTGFGEILIGRDGTNNTINANAGNDVLIGGTGNDTLKGGAGNGGAGTDTAVYSGTLTAANITALTDADPVTPGNQAGWQVSAGAEGTDLLNGVEKVSDGADHHFLLVGNGGYATIQAAINAAANGDTIIVGIGTFSGATISKELTIIGQGSGAGGTIITTGASQYGFDVTGNIDATAPDSQATVTIQGFKFTGNSVGVHVSSTALLDHLVIQNSDFAGNNIHGIGTGSGAFGLDAVDIVNSTFGQNGNGASNGDGDIVLFGFTGDALIKDVTITGGANTVPTNANADTGIQINGRNPSSYDVTQPIGNVVFDNVSVTGSYAKVLVYIQGYTNLDGLSFLNTGTTIVGHAGWGWALAIDPTADETSSATPGVPGEPGFFDVAAAAALAPDTVDLSHVTAASDFGQALGTVFSGTPVADHVTGTDGIDVLVGRDGDDVLNGRGGNDRIDGGAGIDTAVYSGSLIAANMVAVADADPVTAGLQAGWQVTAGAEGADLVTGVEKVNDGAGHHFLLVGNGGYATIQAAVDAAANGDTILISASTFREQVTVSGKKDITIQGAGAGQTIIESPAAASLVAHATDTNSSRPTKYAVITVIAGADVTITGLTLDGRDQGSIPSSPTNYDFLGIYVLNSNAHIDGGAVTGIDELAGPDVSGVQRNLGIVATSHDASHGGNGAHTVEIENSTVSGFQKGGIFVNGLTLTANIHDNTITGVHTANTAQNGIQIGSLFGAGGVGTGDFSGTHATVDHNTITDIGNSGPAGSASGIIVFDGDASGVSITNNTVTGWASPHPTNGNNGIVFVDSNGGTVTGNTISAFDYGLTETNQFGGHLATPFTHSGNTYAGDYQANVLLQPDTTTGITFVGSAGHDELHGGSGNDVLSGLAGNDTIIGGAGTDTATGYDASYHLAIQGGHWVVTNNSETDQLTGVEQAVVAGTTYLLVDQFGANGGYQHVQDAINAAIGAATILIAPGTYTESGSDGIGHTVGLYINKPNLTLQGVDANGAFITTASAAVAVGATIISGHQTGFGANHWVDFGGDGTTIQGLHLQAGVETNNKLLEIWGDNVTVENSFIDIHRGGTVDTGATAVYFNDNGTTSSEIGSYAITGNVLNGAIVVANGVGDPSMHQFGATQLITNNQFEGTFDYATGLGRYSDIVLNGKAAGIAWLLAPTQIPTIAGNTFSDNAAPIILRGLDDDPANFPTVSQVDQILAANGDNNTTYAYVIDPSTGLLRTDDPDLGGGTTHRFIVANSVDTLNPGA